MNRILKIGMDVHSTNYTLCVAEPKLEGEPDYLYEVEVEPDILNVIKVITILANEILFRFGRFHRGICG